MPRESFYESTMSKLISKKQFGTREGGPLASTIEGLRQSIDVKGAVDTKAIVQQVSNDIPFACTKTLTLNIFSAGATMPRFKLKVHETAARRTGCSLHRNFALV